MGLGSPATNGILLIPVNHQRPGLLKFFVQRLITWRQDAESAAAYGPHGFPGGTAHFTFEICLGHRVEPPPDGGSGILSMLPPKKPSQ